MIMITTQEMRIVRRKSQQKLLCRRLQSINYDEKSSQISVFCQRYKKRTGSQVMSKQGPLFTRLANMSLGGRPTQQIQKELLLFFVSTAACCLMINHFRATAGCRAKTFETVLLQQKDTRESSVHFIKANNGLLQTIFRDSLS